MNQTLQAQVEAFLATEPEPLGSGCSRVAYLMGDKVVKVCRYVSHTDFEAITDRINVEEYQNWTALMRMTLPEPFRIPHMELIEVGDRKVIVADYIDGRLLDWDEWEDVLEPFNQVWGFTDLYGDNVIFKDNELWLVDLEC